MQDVERPKLMILQNGLDIVAVVGGEWASSSRL